jgi:hypothetical protein
VCTFEKINVLDCYDERFHFILDTYTNQITLTIAASEKFPYPDEYASFEKKTRIRKYIITFWNNNFPKRFLPI